MLKLLLQDLGTEALKRKMATLLQREAQTQKLCPRGFEVNVCTQSFQDWDKLKPPNNKEQTGYSISEVHSVSSTPKLLKIIGWFFF